MRPLAPDKPRIVTVWGDPLENGSLPLRTNQEESSNISQNGWKGECRTQKTRSAAEAHRLIHAKRETRR
jgi:hypothetical protein